MTQLSTTPEENMINESRKDLEGGRKDDTITCIARLQEQNKKLEKQITDLINEVRVMQTHLLRIKKGSATGVTNGDLAPTPWRTTGRTSEECFPYNDINRNYLMAKHILNCHDSSNRFGYAIFWMKTNGLIRTLRRYLNHSVTCKKNTCFPFCRLFKRIQEHVIFTPDHNCHLLRLYFSLSRPLSKSLLNSSRG